MSDDQAAQQGSEMDDLFAGMSRNYMPSAEQIQRAALELECSPAYLFSRLYPGFGQDAYYPQHYTPSSYGTTPFGVTLPGPQQSTIDERDDIPIDLIVGEIGEEIMGYGMSDLTMDQPSTMMYPGSQSVLPADDASGRAENLPAMRPHTYTDGQGSGSTDITPGSDASWVDLAREPPSALSRENEEAIGFPGTANHWPATIGLSRPCKLFPLPKRGPKTNKSDGPPPPAKEGKTSKPCYRCRKAKRGCDDGNICGPCLDQLTRFGNANCFRYEVSDAALYRVQKQPAQRASQRWATMDMVDLDADDWASNDILTIRVSQTILNAPIELKMRRFIPNATDVTFRSWWDGSQTKRYDMPPYAIANLAEAFQAYRTAIDQYVGIFVDATVRHLDVLIRKTYTAAFCHAKSTQDEFLIRVFRFWVACRISSNPAHIIGLETLGLAPIDDESSNMYGKVPLPPIITPQEQIIIYSGFLIPLSQQIVSQLGKYLKDKNPKVQYTSYLGLFIILHSCSMLTRRNAEYARQINHKDEYVNWDSIAALHSGAITMLAHYHVHRGVRLFDSATTSGDLDQIQVQFLDEISRLAEEKAGLFATIREEKRVGDDLYWVSQLYDKKWEPDKQP